MQTGLDNRKPIVTINLTPLVDVSLVLVVIFMATAPMFMQSGIIVSSGEKKAAVSVQTAAAAEDNIVIRMEGQDIWLNQRQVSEAELSPLLRSMLGASASRRVILNPARDVLHGRVIRIMDLAKQAGADKLVILGRAKESKP